MLNLLIISDHYASSVSHNWSNAYVSSWIINAILIIILICIGIAITSHACALHVSKLKGWLWGILSILPFVLVCVVATFGIDNGWSGDQNSATSQSPSTLSHSLNPHYSNYTNLHTAQIINHHHKILPNEWKHDEYLLHKAGKRPSHDHIALFRRYVLIKDQQNHYQQKLIKQEKFDKYNSKFCTKHYIKQPTTIDYL